MTPAGSERPGADYVRQKMEAIKTTPKPSRSILILKVTSVAFFAIGLEGLVSWNHPDRALIAVRFLTLGVASNSS